MEDGNIRMLVLEGRKLGGRLKQFIYLRSSYSSQ